MGVTLNREDYVRFPRHGIPDSYPKDIREAVRELQRRGYGATVRKLWRMVDTGMIRLQADNQWTEKDIDDVAYDLTMREDYSEIGHYFLYLGVDANRYYRALNDAWEALQREYGNLALPGFPERRCTPEVN